MPGWLSRVWGTKPHVIQTLPEDSGPKVEDMLLTTFRKNGYKCPDCGGILHTGAEGGCAVNVECSDCEARFNIGVAFGEPFFIQRLNRTVISR